MNSKPIVESLMYYTNNQEHMVLSLKLARVLNDKRPWTPKENTELRPHLSSFKEPSVLIVIGLIISVFVISKSKDNKRLFDVVNIEGHSSSIQEMGKSKLVKEANKALNTKDYMPQGYLKHIIWIPYFEKEYNDTTSSDIEIDTLNMFKNDNISEDLEKVLMFTEHINKEWTIDKNIAIPNPSMNMKTTQREILNKIVKEL